jgi:hypothetical protein
LPFSLAPEKYAGKGGADADAAGVSAYAYRVNATHNSVKVNVSSLCLLVMR